MTSIICAAASGTNALEEEPAVWQATVDFIARDSASRPYRVLYFQSDFETGPLVASSMADPIRREFKDLCGLSAADARAMVAQLQAVNAESVVFEEAVAQPAGLKLGKKKSPRGRYVAMSRVVFDPTHQQAWLAVDLGGLTGAIMRMDKVAGQWSRTARCGAWMKSE